MMRMPWHGKFVPHAALDILRGCNCACPYCYNAHRAVAFKPFGEVCEELDALLRLRRLQTISLSGGEPLMHPDIFRIVEEIHRRDIRVAVITNGILLDDGVAERLHQAGCDIVLLHIQSKQIRSDLPEPTASHATSLRAAKGVILRRHGIVPAFVMTLEATDAEGFREAAVFFANSADFEFWLVTVARDFVALANSKDAVSDVDDATILAVLKENGFRPYSFIGGRINKNRPRWHIFHSVLKLNRQGQRAGWEIMRASLLERLFLGLNRLIKGRSVFLEKSTSAKIKLRLLLNALMGGRLSGFPFAMRAIVRGEKVKDKHVLIQLPPFRMPDGRLEWCDDCPDATLKNGALHPICLSDFAPHESAMTEETP